MKNHLEAKEDQQSTINHSNTARTAKQKMLEPRFLTSIMATTKAKEFIHFDSEPEFVM